VEKFGRADCCGDEGGSCLAKNKKRIAMRADKRGKKKKTNEKKSYRVKRGREKKFETLSIQKPFQAAISGTEKEGRKTKLTGNKTSAAHGKFMTGKDELGRSKRKRYSAKGGQVERRRKSRGREVCAKKARGREGKGRGRSGDVINVETAKTRKLKNKHQKNEQKRIAYQRWKTNRIFSTTFPLEKEINETAHENGEGPDNGEKGTPQKATYYDSNGPVIDWTRRPEEERGEAGDQESEKTYMETTGGRDREPTTARPTFSLLR